MSYETRSSRERPTTELAHDADQTNPPSSSSVAPPPTVPVNVPRAGTFAPFDVGKWGVHALTSKSLLRQRCDSAPRSRGGIHTSLSCTKERWRHPRSRYIRDRNWKDGRQLEKPALPTVIEYFIFNCRKMEWLNILTSACMNKSINKTSHWFMKMIN